VSHQREEVVPSYVVECLGDVELECFGSMEPSCEIVHIQVVVVDAPLLDEGTLACRSWCISSASRSARTFVMMVCTRLIGLKSRLSSAPSFLGSKMMLALSIRFRSWQRSS
jgi:hypothetical protein